LAGGAPGATTSAEVDARQDEITGRFPPDAGLRVGQMLKVALDLDRFHLFDPDSGLAIRGADW
jgi:hypothetical protein